jgi:hypothetical protein
VSPDTRGNIDPEESYRADITAALMDAMFEHSRGLNIAENEWLIVAARSNSDRPRLGAVDTDSRTIILKVRGADLASFLAGQISREDARTRMDVKVF